MINISQYCEEQNINEEDFRYSLSRRYPNDWIDREEMDEDAITKLIQEGSEKANKLLPGESLEITPSEELPIEKQEEIINDISQAFGCDIKLALAQDLKAINNALKLRNKVAEITLEQRNQELADVVAGQSEQFRSQMGELMQAFVAGVVKPSAKRGDIAAKIEEEERQFNELLAQVKLGK